MHKELIQKVIAQMQEDISERDYTALYELLNYIPQIYLEGFIDA